MCVLFESYTSAFKAHFTLKADRGETSGESTVFVKFYISILAGLQVAGITARIPETCFRRYVTL